MELKRTIGILTCLLLVLILSSFEERKGLDEDISLYPVLQQLGDRKADHELRELSPELVEQGRQLIHEGKSKGSSYISKYFVCTSCHNTVREDPVLTSFDPEARLNFALEKKIPFLQASTFWGIVNRESWYNDDYVKKYGDLVVKANKRLEESIQLCATVCSAGRKVTADEMNAMLAYFWSLQLKLKDLDLDSEEFKLVEEAMKNNSKSDKVIAMLKSKYALKSPATFVDAPENKVEGYGMTGRPELGEKIFDLSCKQCHRPHGESDVVFEDSKKTYKWFLRNINDKGNHSLYNIIRYGTYSERSHPEYMPHYTAERMSNQQIEDLRSFFTSQLK